MGYWSAIDVDLQERALATFVVYVLPWWLLSGDV